MQSSTLREAQRSLSARIVSHWSADAANVAGLFGRPPRGALEQRLGVYADGYVARLHDALRETYPALAHLAGGRRFAALARRYAVGCRTDSYNLNDCGADLVEFLRADPLAEDYSFAPDLAQLEWRVAQAFHAAEFAPFDPATTAGWSEADWQGAVLRFQPSVALVRSVWPIRSLWQTRATPLREIDIDLADPCESVLVFRSTWDVRVEGVVEGEARAISGLMAGRPLGRVAAEVVAAGFTAESAFQWLRRCQPHGIIRDCQ